MARRKIAAPEGAAQHWVVPVLHNIMGTMEHLDVQSTRPQVSVIWSDGIMHKEYCIMYILRGSKIIYCIQDLSRRQFDD